MSNPPRRDKFGRFIAVDRIEYEIELRDRFAESAMVALIHNNPTWPIDHHAYQAWKIANEMMERR